MATFIQVTPATPRKRSSSEHGNRAHDPEEQMLESYHMADLEASASRENGKRDNAEQNLSEHAYPSDTPSHHKGLHLPPMGSIQQSPHPAGNNSNDNINGNSGDEHLRPRKPSHSMLKKSLSKMGIMDNTRHHSPPPLDDDLQEVLNSKDLEQLRFIRKQQQRCGQYSRFVFASSMCGLLLGVIQDLAGLDPDLCPECNGVRVLGSFFALMSVIFLIPFYNAKVHLMTLENLLPPKSTIFNTYWILRDLLCEMLVVIIHQPPFINIPGTNPGGVLRKYLLMNHDTITLFMFTRLYQIPRVIFYSSPYYKEGRLLGALAGIFIDRDFTIRAFFQLHPVISLSAFGGGLALLFSYGMFTCERGNHPLGHFNNFAEAIWSCLITMLTVGYGDVVPVTYCGRTFAILSAMTGTLVISFTIIVVSGKLTVNDLESRVIHMVNRHYRHTQLADLAARLVQTTWKHYSRDGKKMSWQSRQNVFKAIELFRNARKRAMAAEVGFDQAMGQPFLNELTGRISEVDESIQHKIDGLVIEFAARSAGRGMKGTISESATRQDDGATQKLTERMTSLETKMDNVTATLSEIVTLLKSNNHER